MKYRGKRLGSMFLCAALIAALLPARVSAAFEHMAVERKLPQATVDYAAKIQSLKDGEVYTYTEVSLQDPAGSALPETDFSVSLAAVGQKYPTTTITVRPTVTVLVLDTSGSMNFEMGGTKDTGKNRRIAALRSSAKSFVEEIVDNSNNGKNYVAVVNYGSQANRSASFTNVRQTLNTAIDNLNVTGGTNTHSGLIAAYKMISNPTAYGLPANLENPTYSILLMSDGVPTYYYQLTSSQNDSAQKNNSISIYDRLKFVNTLEQGSNSDFIRRGGGNDSQSATELQRIADHAISAAQILKEMSALKPMVYSIYLKNSGTLDERAATTMAQIASKRANSQPFLFLPSTTNELTEAFADIAVSIKSQATPPIAEVEKDGALSPVSYVDMSYNLGSGYTLVGDTMQVSLGDKLYTFTRQANGSYVGNESGLEKLGVSVNGGVVKFRVPASLLPCNEPTPATGTKTVAEPIKLFFTLRIDAAKVNEAGEYPTASASTAKFYPTVENPFYYGENGYQMGNKTLVAKNTTKDVKDYYRASYSNPMPSPAAVTSFQVGMSSPPQTYADLESVKVTGVSGTTLSVQYTSPDSQIGVRDITFTSRTEKKATLSLTTPDKNDVSKFTGMAFNDGDGNTAYDSLRLENGGIRVVYQGGKRSVFFAAPAYAEQKTIQTANGKFTCTSNGTVTLNEFTISDVNDGKNLSGAKLTASEKSHSEWWFGWSGTYAITVEHNGVVWDFGNITFEAFLSSTATASKSIERTLGTVYKLNNVQQSYYVTEAVDTRAVPVEKYRFSLSGDRLQVQTRADENAAWSTIGDHTGGGGTSIATNQQGGYTVTSIAGQTVTTTEYTVVDGTLYKQVSTNRLGGVDATGWVTQSHTEFGAITLTVKLTAEDIITSAELTSLSGTKMAVATSGGAADLLLTLTVSGNVSGISGLNLADALKLSVKVGDSMPSTPFAYQIKGVKRGGTVVTDYTGTLEPGTYQITLSTKSSYSDPKQKPGSATVSLDQIRFAINGGKDPFTLQGRDQSVKLVLVTTTGH